MTQQGDQQVSSVTDHNAEHMLFATIANSARWDTGVKLSSY